MDTAHHDPRTLDARHTVDLGELSITPTLGNSPAPKALGATRALVYPIVMRPLATFLLRIRWQDRLRHAARKRTRRRPSASISSNRAPGRSRRDGSPERHHPRISSGASLRRIHTKLSIFTPSITHASPSLKRSIRGARSALRWHRETTDQAVLPLAGRRIMRYGGLGSENAGSTGPPAIL